MVFLEGFLILFFFNFQNSFLSFSKLFRPYCIMDIFSITFPGAGSAACVPFFATLPASFAPRALASWRAPPYPPPPRTFDASFLPAPPPRAPLPWRSF